MSKLFATVGLAVFLAGCVPSWNPFFTENDLLFDADLIGIWAEKKGVESWIFSKAGKNNYKLVQRDSDGMSAEFEVHLVKLKERRFLDIYLTDASQAKLNEWASISLIPTHLILQVHGLNDSTLKLSVMDPQWLAKHLEENPKAIEHRKLSGDRIVLTASTKELQQFVLKHAEGEALFGPPGELKRQKL